MDLLNSRDKINIFFILSLVSIIFYGTSGWALDPTVTDVTTRSFSVVWTEDGTITDSEDYSLEIKNTNNELLKEYKDLSVSGDANQIDISMESDTDALTRRVYKFEVIGLDIDTPYRCQGKKSNGSTTLFSGIDYEEVTTEKFRGLAPEADSNDTDIVTNDIVHVAVFNDPDNYAPKEYGKPALGALVMAEIYADAECINNKRSDYPITGWVGSGMPGEAGATDFDPNVVSYKQYAPLNLLNVFGMDNYPLQLTGDDASTPEIDGEYIKVTVIEGIVEVDGETDYIMPVPEITEVEVETDVWQKISSAKVSTYIKFRAGMNTFSYPAEIPGEGTDAQLTTEQFIRIIYELGGRVTKIKRLAASGAWPSVSVDYFSNGEIDEIINGHILLEPGKGYLVFMESAMAEGFTISGYPKVTDVVLHKGMNFMSFGQIPDYYETADFIRAIAASGGKVNKIKRLSSMGAWPSTSVDYLSNGEIDEIISSALMEKGAAYLVFMDSSTVGDITVDPFTK